MKEHLHVMGCWSEMYLVVVLLCNSYTYIISIAIFFVYKKLSRGGKMVTIKFQSGFVNILLQNN